MKGIEGFIHRILLGYKVDEAILHSMKKTQILKKIDEIIAIMIYDSMYRKAYLAKAEHRMYAVNAIMPVESSILETDVYKLQYNAIATLPVESSILETDIYKPQYNAIATLPVESSILETDIYKPQYNTMTVMPSQYDKTEIIYKKAYEISRE